MSDTRHSNVVELLELRRYDGLIVFVMEYVNGPDLAAYLRECCEREPMPLAEAIRIMLNVVEALKLIHSKRVYHGDLKPANVLVSREDGTVKVTDFSISRSVGTRSGSEEKVAGTPLYMAPEGVGRQPASAVRHLLDWA